MTLVTDLRDKILLSFNYYENTRKKTINYENTHLRKPKFFEVKGKVKSLNTKNFRGNMAEIQISSHFEPVIKYMRNYLFDFT